jgi:hypothetical protein
MKSSAPAFRHLVRGNITAPKDEGLISININPTDG